LDGWNILIMDENASRWIFFKEKKKSWQVQINVKLVP
jgi:hypothetical protein